MDCTKLWSSNVCNFLVLQVNNGSAVENQFPSKRLADGSKRVRVPYFLSPQVN